ncbi:MAG: hypothetical protein GW892_19640 [Armatimonadetes bacterium]|nr:hypothetical protein [Armatimonadota bacterium]
MAAKHIALLPTLAEYDPATLAPVRESPLVPVTARAQDRRSALASRRAKLSDSPPPAKEAMWAAERRFLWIRPDQVDWLRDFVESIALGQRPACLAR